MPFIRATRSALASLPQAVRPRGASAATVAGTGAAVTRRHRRWLGNGSTRGAEAEPDAASVTAILPPAAQAGALCGLGRADGAAALRGEADIPEDLPTVDVAPALMPHPLGRPRLGDHPADLEALPRPIGIACPLVPVALLPLRGEAVHGFGAGAGEEALAVSTSAATAAATAAVASWLPRRWLGGRSVRGGGGPGGAAAVEARGLGHRTC
mmetsp:Transcript_20501/g.70934  ORF Transcript_20501/g.70934 Transcript_20501/m.70934 type:complete len:211 (-) Transcript_20501:145-777(-)